MKLSIVFAAYLGFALAGPSLPDKENLLDRIFDIDRTLLKASRNFTQHGLKYFAEIIGRTQNNVEQLRNMTEAITGEVDEIDDLDHIDRNLILIERELPRLISDPAPRELIKAGGLYLSLALVTQNGIPELTDRSVELIERVEAIIAQEQTIAKFGPEHLEAVKKLGTLYHELSNLLNDDRLPTMQKLFTLEAAANEAIKKYNKLGDKETSKDISEHLLWFQIRSGDLAELLPIQDEAKVSKFTAIVPHHYDNYRDLKALVFGDREGIKKADNYEN